MNFSLKVDSLEIYFSNIHDTSHSQPGDYYYFFLFFLMIGSPTSIKLIPTTEWNL